MHCTATLVDPAATELRIASLFTASPESGLEEHTATMRRWVLEFLSKSHPDLGRKGPVCPYTSPAIKRDLLWVAFLRGGDLERDDITRALTAIIQEFRRRPPTDGDDSHLKSVVLAFPDFSDVTLIESIQLEFKNLFIKYGLMVGQFYPGCDVGGLWNPDFKALDAPYPMLAVRHMTETDYPFLVENEEWLNAYFTHFAPRIPTRVRSDMIKRLLVSA
ncbi:DUF6875 domain-containing protein [Antrihabitans cavernicola]|uniref:DUF6875 domain-containing protein n=1 Tax=Antrihabitans cavernicola TaxID=2495913 RepID=A0A5A7SE05_9NOCA|nr:hypothetical protein [Spelaeibacter cavernicola]KAA0023794.1 hypothetical protein FOY51_04105 [Spelaeibacter cavernicola]